MEKEITQLGRFEIIRPLAEGGFGQVFLARMGGAAGFQRTVALKQIRGEYTQSPDFVSDFIKEARIGGYLQHHNVVQVLGFEEVDGSYVLVMEYVEGVDLAFVIENAVRWEETLSLSLIAEIAAQTCEGLQYLHTLRDPDGRPLRLIHRDLKPSNLLINRAGIVKITDFGIARAAIEVGKKTQAGLIKGTLAYLSPEQARGEPLDHRSDLYALGAIVYELATRRRLYSEETPWALLNALGSNDIGEALETFPSRVAPLLPILKSLLTSSPDDRCPSAAHAAEAFRAIQQSAQGGETLALAAPRWIEAANQFVRAESAPGSDEALRTETAGREPGAGDGLEALDAQPSKPHSPTLAAHLEDGSSRDKGRAAAVSSDRIVASRIPETLASSEKPASFSARGAVDTGGGERTRDDEVVKAGQPSIPSAAETVQLPAERRREDGHSSNDASSSPRKALWINWIGPAVLIVVFVVGLNFLKMRSDSGSIGGTKRGDVQGEAAKSTSVRGAPREASSTVPSRADSRGVPSVGADTRKTAGRMGQASEGEEAHAPEVASARPSNEVGHGRPERGEDQTKKAPLGRPAVPSLTSKKIEPRAEASEGPSTRAVGGRRTTGPVERTSGKERPRKDASSAGAASSSNDGKMGRLTIASFPSAHVVLEGKVLGETPLTGMEMKPGRYRLQLSRPDLGFAYTIEATVEPGKEARFECTKVGCTQVRTE